MPPDWIKAAAYYVALELAGTAVESEEVTFSWDQLEAACLRVETLHDSPWIEPSVVLDYWRQEETAYPAGPTSERRYVLRVR